MSYSCFIRLLFSVDAIDFMADMQNVRCKYKKKGKNHQTISVFFYRQLDSCRTKRGKA